MEPYLGEYLALSSEGIAKMLAYRHLILTAHKNPQEGEIRVAALEEALRQVKAREAKELQRRLTKELERREKRKGRGVKR